MRRHILLLCVLVAAGHPGPAVALPPETWCATAEEVQLLNLINAYRLGAGLEPVALSQTLGAAAEHHSWAMAEHNLLTHTVNEADGSRVTWDRNILNHDYPAVDARGLRTRRGEVLVAGMSDPWRVFDALRRSPAHNAVLLATSFVATGIGYAHDPDSRWSHWWTATFGSVLDRAGCVVR
jgi:uncharacterized protein YkwD